MTLSKAMKDTVKDIHTGYSGKALYRSNYNAKTIDALEDRGLIEVREYDGALRLTSSGEHWLFSRPKKTEAVILSMHPQSAKVLNHWSYVGRTRTELSGGTRVKIGKWLESGGFFTWDTGYITRDKRFWPDKDEFSNLENVTVREY